jgi:hypothetical protein
MSHSTADEADAGEDEDGPDDEGADDPPEQGLSRTGGDLEIPEDHQEY